MALTSHTYNKWLRLFAAGGMLLSFFLPWVKWGTFNIAGKDLPGGNFFNISAAHFGLANPFPQLAPSLLIFWMIPALLTIVFLYTLINRKTSIYSFIAVALSLALVTVFFLFSSTLIDLGVDTQVSNMLKLGIFLQVFFSLLLLVVSSRKKNVWVPLLWLLVGPVIAYGSYKYGEKKIFSETFTHTNEIPTDFTINAPDLLKEFAINDAEANKKYQDKMMIVNGTVSKVEPATDGTLNIHFADSTGSYIVFSFDSTATSKVKHIKEGYAVSLKGSCSGSIFSQILGTTSISFKRSSITK